MEHRANSNCPANKKNGHTGEFGSARFDHVNRVRVTRFEMTVAEFK